MKFLEKKIMKFNQMLKILGLNEAFLKEVQNVKDKNEHQNENLKNKDE